MAFDVLELLFPASGVCLVGRGTPGGRELRETGFDDLEERSTGDLLEPELDQAGGLARIVHAPLHRERMPPEGEVRLRLDALHPGLQGEVLVARVRDRTGDALAGAELTGELHPEPGRELAGFGQRTPHPRAGRTDQDLLLDAIRNGFCHTQPPRCATWISFRRNATGRLPNVPNVFDTFTQPSRNRSVARGSIGRQGALVEQAAVSPGGEVNCNHEVARGV